MFRFSIITLLLSAVLCFEAKAQLGSETPVATPSCSSAIENQTLDHIYSILGKVEKSREDLNRALTKMYSLETNDGIPPRSFVEAFQIFNLLVARLSDVLTTYRFEAALGNSFNGKDEFEYTQEIAKELLSIADELEEKFKKTKIRVNQPSKKNLKTPQIDLSPQRAMLQKIIRGDLSDTAPRLGFLKNPQK
jgi:hypothetical protein